MIVHERPRQRGSAAARPGTVTTALHETLTAIHQGHMPDAHGRVRH